MDAVNPPAHYALAKFVYGFGGDPLLNLRWISIVASVLSLLLLSQCGYFSAAVLIAVNAWFIHYSQELRSYAMLFLGVAAMLMCLEKAKGSWLIFLSVAGLVWSHYFGILYVFAALIAYRERWKPMALGLASILPWLFFVAMQFFNGQAASNASWIPKATLTGLLRYFSRLGIGWPNALFPLPLVPRLHDSCGAPPQPNAPSRKPTPDPDCALDLIALHCRNAQQVRALRFDSCSPRLASSIASTGLRVGLPV